MVGKAVFSALRGERVNNTVSKVRQNTAARNLYLEFAPLSQPGSTARSSSVAIDCVCIGQTDSMRRMYNVQVCL